MTTALIPGSFDPLHLGHLDVIEVASRLFDTVVVAAVRNPGKGEPLFTLDERKAMIAEATAHLDNVEIESASGLTVDLARTLGADCIVKGIRGASDFDREVQMAQMNVAVSTVPTVFVPCATTTSFIASSLVKEIARFGGGARVAELVPAAVGARLTEKFAG